MKCPNCGFNSFDYLSACKRCGSPLEPNPTYRAVYEPVVEAGKQKSAKLDENAMEKPASGVVLPEPDLPHARSLSGPQTQSVLVETFAPDKNEMKEDEATSSSISSAFLPYEPSSGESQQEQSDIGSPVTFTSPISDFSPEWFQSKEEALSFDLAGIGSRVTAFIIDLMLIFGIAALTLGVGLFFTHADFSVDTERLIDVLIPIYFVLLFLGSTYFVFLQGFAGKTIGKMVLGIRIIRDDGESMGLWEAFVRWLGYFVSAFFVFIGFIWAIFDSKSQTWHDKFAGTYVVKEGKLRVGD